jgi:uncharacterized protein YvpB
MRMRRALSVAMVTALAVVVGGPLGAPLASAQSASIDAWIEFATVEPGAGCVVDVSVDGGAGIAGADVSLVVSDDSSGAVVSSDSGTANDSGIAWLVIDTSGAAAGTKAWASVNVNGSYLGGQTVWITPDGGCSGASTLLTVSGNVSTSSTSSSASEPAAETSNSGAVVIPGAFGYHQQRGLSCEYASLAIATGMLGDWVSEYDFEAVVPLNANPHWGYRGDITGSWGNTTNYGVYAAPLVSALNQYGFQGEEFYGGRGDLMYQLDLGRPTLVWIGARGEAGSFYEWTADGTRYQLTPYMHVVVVYGYDDWGVYVSDPGNGALSHWDWAAFEGMWGVMDGMALAVHW